MSTERVQRAVVTFSNSDVLRDIHRSGKEPTPKHPGVRVTALLDNWERVERELVRPYLEGRLRHVQDEQEQGEGPGS